MEKKKSSSSAKKSTAKKTVKTTVAKKANVVKEPIVKEPLVTKEVVKKETKKKSDHSLFKALIITFLLVVVLSWIIPTGQYDGTEFVLSPIIRTGFNELFLSIFYGANYYLVQIMYLIVLGIFYGIVSKTKGYQSMVTSIAKMWKGKEKLFILLNSLIIALMTSVFTHPFVALTFVPLLYSVASRLKINKLSTVMMTFGSLLVGLMGMTYSNYGVEYISAYMGTEATVMLSVRFGILAIGYLVLNIFNIMMMDKDKSTEAIEEIYETEEVNTNGKIGYFITFAIIFVILVLGYLNWETVFKLDIFTKFHTWLTTNVLVGEEAIFANILGNMVAFGSWDLFNIMSILMFILVIIVGIRIIVEDVKESVFVKKLITNIIVVVGSLVIAFILNIFKINVFSVVIAALALYLSVRFILNGCISDILDNALCGIKKMIKPLVLITFAYAIFVLCYWSGMSITMINWLNTRVFGFNPYLNAIGNALATALHVDFGFTGFMLGAYYNAMFADFVNKIFLIMVTMNGLVSFIAPTSVVMLVGLSLSNVSYKEWCKYIWKFVVAMLIILFVLYTII